MKIEVNNGSILEFEYGTKVSATNIEPHTQKIVVKSGGKLVINEDAIVNLNCKIEVFGEMELKKNSKLNCNMILVQPGGKLFINEGAIVFYEKSEIPPYNKITGTGKISLDYNSEMQVIGTNDPDDFPTFIMEGILLKKKTFEPPEPGGKLIVKSDASLVIGPITSEPTTTIDIQKGANVYFYYDDDTHSKNNYIIENKIGGNLYIGVNGTGPNTIVEGFGYDDAVTTPYNTPPKYDYCDNPNKKYIFAKLNCINNFIIGQPSFNQELQGRNTDFANVAINVRGKLKFPLSDCTFNTNSAKLFSHFYGTLEADKLPKFFFDESEFIRCLGSDPSPLCDLTIIRSKFKDENIMWDAAAQSGIRIGGVSLYNLRDVLINNNGLEHINDHGDFENLDIAINSYNCRSVIVKETEIFRCNKGTVDNNSSEMLCQNSFEIVKNASNFIDSKQWAVYDNDYKNTFSGIQLLDGTVMNFRGNEFNQFYQGIRLEDGIAWLTSHPILFDLFNIKAIIYGRNKFVTSDSLTHKFSENNDIRFHSDVHFAFPSPLLVILCGLNWMSEGEDLDGGLVHPYHLTYYNINPNPALYTNHIFCTQNDWNWADNPNHHEVRLYPNQIAPNSIDQTPPLYLWGTFDGCEEAIGDFCIYPEFICGTNIFTNIGNWPTYSPTHAFLDTAYYLSRNNMFNQDISFECRRYIYMDAIQAATLEDSTEIKYNQLVNDFEIISNDNSLPISNRTKALILKGEAYERLGKLDSAEIEYNRIINTFSSSLDTMQARWGLLHINAIKSDTIFGVVYDSLMNIYVNRVIQDLDFHYDTSGGGGSAKRAELEDIEVQIKNWKEEDVAIKLDKNNPNPFESLTEIQYFLSKDAHATLILYDLNGKAIANLIDKNIKAGWHNIIVNGSGLTSGSYILRLESESQAVVKTIMKL